MGHRHQVYVVNKKVGSLRVVCAVHHQRLHGVAPLVRLNNFLRLLGNPENGICVKNQRDLLSLLQKSYELNLEEGGFQRTHAIEVCYSPEEHLNDNGITVIDISNLSQPRYCFLFFHDVRSNSRRKAKGLFPLTAEQYIRCFHGSSQVSTDEDRKLEAQIHSQLRLLSPVEVLASNDLLNIWPRWETLVRRNKKEKRPQLSRHSKNKHTVSAQETKLTEEWIRLCKRLPDGPQLLASVPLHYRLKMCSLLCDYLLLRNSSSSFGACYLQNPSLTRVSLTHCGELLNDRHISLLAKSCAQLRELELHGSNSLSDDTIRVVSRYCPYLIKLGLRGCRRITGNNFHLLQNNFFLEQLFFDWDREEPKSLKANLVQKTRTSWQRAHQVVVLTNENSSLIDFDIKSLGAVGSLMRQRLELKNQWKNGYIGLLAVEHPWLYGLTAVKLLLHTLGFLQSRSLANPWEIPCNFRTGNPLPSLYSASRIENENMTFYCRPVEIGSGNTHFELCSLGTLMTEETREITIIGSYAGDYYYGFLDALKLKDSKLLTEYKRVQNHHRGRKPASKRRREKQQKDTANVKKPQEPQQKSTQNKPNETTAPRAMKDDKGHGRSKQGKRSHRDRESRSHSAPSVVVQVMSVSAYLAQCYPTAKTNLLDKEGRRRLEQEISSLVSAAAAFHVFEWEVIKPLTVSPSSD